MAANIKEAALKWGEDGLREELERLGEVLGLRLQDIMRILGIGKDENLMDFLKEIMQLIKDRVLSLGESLRRSIHNTSASTQSGKAPLNGENSPSHESIALSHEINMPLEQQLVIDSQHKA